MLSLLWNLVGFEGAKRVIERGNKVNFKEMLHAYCLHIVVEAGNRHIITGLFKSILILSCTCPPENFGDK